MNLADQLHLVPNIFLFVERKCFSDWRIGKDWIDFHDLTFVVSGKACYYVNGEKYLVEAGDLIYIPENSVREAHTFESSPMHAYPFNFQWAGLLNNIHLPFGVVTKKMISKEILDHIQEFKHVWMNKQPFYMFQARAIFELILHRLLSNYYLLSTPIIDPRIKKITTYIEENYSRDIIIGELAESVNLHPVYFGKLFKEFTGSTCKEYLNRIRINNAEMMLSSGDFTVSEAAERCGFRDISYFSNMFKQLKGHSPSAIKKKTEQNEEKTRS